MTPIVILGKEIFQPASKAVLKQLKKWGAKVIPKKEVTPAVKAKAKTVTEKNISDKQRHQRRMDQRIGKRKQMVRKIPEGVGGKVRTLTKAERKGMPIETYTHGGPKGTASRPRPKPIPRPGSTNIGTKATAGKSEAVLERHQKMKPRGVIKKPTKKAKDVKKKSIGERLKDRGYDLDDLDASNPFNGKKKGGPIKGKPVNGITRAGKPVNGIKGTKVAKADWMKGLTAEQIKQILGAPTADPSGVVRHSKKKTKKPTKVRKAKGGGMTGEGLYPAEEARSGTMSQARRKKYMKKGGKITYRMTGGQVVDAGYD